MALDFSRWLPAWKDHEMEPVLSECRPPWVVATRADDPWAAIEVAKLREQGGKVVRLAGRQLHSPASLFAVFARELSFPGYFGHNWDALVDCLHPSPCTSFSCFPT